ncbi:MAG: 3-phosphoshikimate 1-carboxyvinyltransferase [Gemmataceae bacterium]|nr:3-phosphoshikimate 1-carboxyvinyltransferase [Gemmataceae bacterium]MDW8264419.1 3-phosphoshikimate 1-carboxyvinyltransferase [Gemmataceae bacterium]
MTDAGPAYPEQLEITPLGRPPRATIRVPGSKSMTNRALVLAALTDPRHGCELHGVLHSDDTEIMARCLSQLGYAVETDWPRERIHVRRAPSSRLVPAAAADLFVGNSGTTMRFLTALVSLGQGRYRLDGVPRMRERPIEDLLDALRQLGVHAYSERGNGCPPVVVESTGLSGGTVHVKGDVSSQFLSGLLMAAPLARGPMTITTVGPLVSRLYVTMTLEMMRRFGASVETDDPGSFHVRPQPSYQATRFDIEPDATAASYFLGAAAITQGEVTIEGLGQSSLQADAGFLDCLAQMGCEVERQPTAWRLRGRPLHGIDVDMNTISDTVMTLAAVACFAQGPTTIRNVAHIRHKETDRLVALATELRRIGAEVDERADGLTIWPKPLHAAVVETYDDHRMAMSLALVGLRVPGIVIRHPGCVAKTYPRFFDDLEKLRC